MEMVLKWDDKKGLKNYADELIRSAPPELKKKYPTPRNKDKTYIVDFRSIEAQGGSGLVGDLPLNGFGREAYEALSVLGDMSEFIFDDDFQPVLDKFTPKQKFVFERRMFGYKQQEIADEMGISRKNVVKHLNLIKTKIEKNWRDNGEIHH